MFPSTQTDNYLLLTHDKPETLLAMQELWDTKSRIPGLLTARPLDYPYQKGYAYDQKERKYYSFPSGRAISDKRIKAAIKRISIETGKRAKKETQQLIAGTILAVWYSRMRDLLKALYKTVWLVSIGGFLFDDDTQRNLFYAFILSQFGYLDNFAQQIESGEQPLNGLTVERAGMYGLHGWAEYQNIGLERAPEEGYTEARRILAPIEYERHCHEGDRPGCVEEADKGWMPISQMVPLGQCSCYSRCMCDVEFR
jgi:hypothetical protein